MRSAWQWHGRFYLPHNVDDLLFDLVSQQSWFCLIFYYYFQRTFLHLLHGLIPFFFFPLNMTKELCWMLDSGLMHISD